MTNKQLLEKMQEDMKMREFSEHTKYSYYHKAIEITQYFGKSMKQVSKKELRDFLMKYLREERKMEEVSVNYYNSVIRFMYDVVLDYPINQKQLPMYKKKRRLPKIYNKIVKKIDTLLFNTFFNFSSAFIYNKNSAIVLSCCIIFYFILK